MFLNINFEQVLHTGCDWYFTSVVIFLMNHPVEMMLVPDAAPYFSCRARCTLPGKHQQQSPHHGLRGVIGQPTVYKYFNKNVG